MSSGGGSSTAVGARRRRPGLRALDRKLLRDLRAMWSQALTIALVVASGIASFVACLSAIDSLAAARDGFYAEGRFADVFAELKRAPDSLVERIAALDGVADVQVTVEQTLRIEIEDSADPILAHLIGLDAAVPRRLNKVVVTSGRAPSLGEAARREDGAIEALVSEAFAAARALKPGAKLQALVNGKRRSLIVVGTAVSPEYVFAGLWGMPDVRGFGVFWVDRDAIAAPYDMRGAFNRVSLLLAPGASEPALVSRLGTLLAPYGSRQPHGRAEQASHAMLDNEIQGQRVIGTVLPSIFVGVAAFLLHVVVSRLVATQREQIAAVKALGYGNAAIAAHYLQLVLLIVAAGIALGAAAGNLLGMMLSSLFTEFYRFPQFTHRVAPWLLAGSVAVGLLTAAAGALQAIFASVRLAPAEAMRPPAPGRYRRTLLERLGIGDGAPALRMIVRNVERRPLRSLLAVLGIAAAMAIVVLGNFFRDAMDVIVDSQFRLALRGDVSMWTTEPVPAGAARELARLPGARAVEAVRFVPVTLVNGHRRERSLIRGYAPRAELYRVVDSALRPWDLDGRGLVLTDRLADKLGVGPGDRVGVEVLEGDMRRLEWTVGAVVPETMGLNAYLARDALNAALGDGDVASGFVLGVWRAREAALLEASKALPRLAGAWSKSTMLRNMEEISARNVRIMSTILTAFAVIIAVGVVYNHARIALAERAWELASLRVLGFTRGEVAGLLLGEMALIVACAIPLGIALGQWLVSGVAELMRSDAFHFPVVLRPATFANAALVVLLAAVGSALALRRRIDRIDIVSALKTRQ